MLVYVWARKWLCKASHSKTMGRDKAYTFCSQSNWSSSTLYSSAPPSPRRAPVSTGRTRQRRQPRNGAGRPGEERSCYCCCGQCTAPCQPPGATTPVAPPKSWACTFGRLITALQVGHPYHQEEPKKWFKEMTLFHLQNCSIGE